MPKPPTVTLEQVRERAPKGVARPQDGTEWFRRNSSLPLDGAEVLSPEQIVERLRVVECGTCEPAGSGIAYLGPRQIMSECPECHGSGYIDPDPQLRSLFA